MRSLATLLMALVIAGCMDKNRGLSKCATPLYYVTNAAAIGDDAIRGAAQYRARIKVGSDNNVVSAKVDTGSSNLIINASHFSYGDNTITGHRPYINAYSETPMFAVPAQDMVDIGCFDDVKTGFSLTAKEGGGENVLGLAFGDHERLPHEEKVPSFFGQLVKNSNTTDLFSLALCQNKPTSHILFGGVDSKMNGLIGKFIPIIERSSYVVPAQTLRIMSTKRVIGRFESYDPATKVGNKTYLDSGTAFLLLPPKMAQNFAKIVANRATELGFTSSISPNFYRTNRSASTATVRFESEAQIRQFPNFEITFLGQDGTTKALELSPEHYLKPVAPHDPMIRTFAVRETTGDAVLGQPFLENHYVVFERDQNRIGFGDIDIACGK